VPVDIAAEFRVGRFGFRAAQDMKLVLIDRPSRQLANVAEQYVLAAGGSGGQGVDEDFQFSGLLDDCWRGFKAVGIPVSDHDVCLGHGCGAARVSRVFP